MKHLTICIIEVITLLFSAVYSSRADVVITELMPCNTSTYINDLYDYVGYAELYNDGDVDVELKGYSFANDKKGGLNKWTWTINTSCVVKSKQYRMVFFDEVVDRQYHVGYKLDTDGGELRLVDKNSKTISSVKYTQQYPHLSYGVGINGILGYMEPSPKASNTIAYSSIKSRCAKPTFSVAPGVKKEAVSLELSTSTENATIYYTTNGDIPVVGTSKKYTAPIEIKSNVVVRAIAVKDSMLKSEIATGSYIYSDVSHNRCNGLTANIVSIVTDNKFYYDDMQGIYVDGKNGTTMTCITTPKNYAQDWTRAATMEYIVDSAVVVSQEVETSIKGGCSRASATKSLGIKSNKKSGKKGFDYVFFPEQRPGIKYDALHLRNGGNAYTSSRFRDGYMSSIANALGLECQAYEPVAAYINGKYMGLMGLRSPANKSYVETHYGLDETEIDFIEMSQKIEVTAGDTVAYNSLISSLRKTDPSSADYYSNASKLMDMDNYIDYNIFEQYIGNSDWPGNNQKLWREHNGGKFRWILYDLDFGFGLYNNTLSMTSTNMLKYALGEPAFTWNKEAWMISPFAELMKNDEFKYRFLIKFMHHLKYSFTENMIDSVWMDVSDKMADEYCASGGVADKSFSSIRKFALDRPTYIYQHLKDYYKAGNKVSLQVAVKDVYGKLIPSSAILINNEALGTTDYKVDYYAGIPLKVDVRAPAGYKFQRWNLSSKVSDAVSSTPVFEGKLSADIVMTAVFIKDTDPKPWTLQINEICSSNNSVSGNADECGHYSDWIEIYNYGTEVLDLAGMYITDDPADMTKYKIPYGSADTKIEPGKCVVVWADDEPWRGALHTNFKISSSGSFIGLAYNMQKENTYLDSMSCPRLNTNDSYGRSGNGEAWTTFSPNGELKVTFGLPNDTLLTSIPQDTIVDVPQDTTEIVIPQDTIVDVPQDTTEIVIPQDTIIDVPQDTTEIVIPQDTIVDVPQDTTEIVIPQDTIVDVPQDTTEIVIPQDTIVDVPQDTTEIVIPQDTIVDVPQDTTEIVIPQDTIVDVPQDTTDIVIPQDTIVDVPQDTTEIVIPQDTIIDIPLDSTGIDSLPVDTTLAETPDPDKIISSLEQLISADETFVVYPNPARNELFVMAAAEDRKIKMLMVYSLHGMQICSAEGSGGPMSSIPIETLKPGIYILRIETNESVIHKRFEKK